MGEIKMTVSRVYSTRRQGIIKAIADKLKTIDGTGEFLYDFGGNVAPNVKFWDEIEEFPQVHVNAGSETRRYQGGGYKDRFMSVVVRVYVQEEDSLNALDRALEDIETVLEDNASLEYFDKHGVSQCIKQITIVQIDTDEGLLDPIGVGEVNLLVHY